jgi:hypothetical protein
MMSTTIWSQKIYAVRHLRNISVVSRREKKTIAVVRNAITAVMATRNATVPLRQKQTPTKQTVVKHKLHVNAPMVNVEYQFHHHLAHATPVIGMEITIMDAVIVEMAVR